jgi:hypothetical protein
MRAPESALTAYDLVAAGWPADRVAPLAGTNRVYVALALLRKLGLKQVIERTSDGYRLDARVPIVLARSGARRLH